MFPFKHLLYVFYFFNIQSVRILQSVQIMKQKLYLHPFAGVPSANACLLPFDVLAHLNDGSVPSIL